MSETFIGSTLTLLEWITDQLEALNLGLRAASSPAGNAGAGTEQDFSFYFESVNTEQSYPLSGQTENIDAVTICVKCRMLADEWETMQALLAARNTIESALLKQYQDRNLMRSAHVVRLPDGTAYMLRMVWQFEYERVYDDDVV